MRAGILRHRITIQRNANGVANAYGEIVQGWADVATIPAQVKILDAKESWKIKQTVPEATIEVLIRYHQDITSSDRLKWGSRYLNIISIVPDEINTQQTILCQERL